MRWDARSTSWTLSSATSRQPGARRRRDSRGAARDSDIVVLPELAVTGYPPEEMLLRPGFLKAARASLDEITRATEGITALVGVPLLDRDLGDACAVLSEGG